MACSAARRRRSSSRAAAPVSGGGERRAASARRADLVGDCSGLPGCADGDRGEAGGEDSRWRLRILTASSEGRAEGGAVTE